MAAIASKIFFLLVACFIFGRAETVFAEYITLNSTLFPNIHPTSWLSQSGRFAFGFYQQSGYGFKVGIWLTGAEKKIVWTAHRDDPPVSSKARLQLTMKGLLLQTGQRKDKLIDHSNNQIAVSFASMLDTGNFVLYDKNSKMLWQSFNCPTDTMLGGQNLHHGDQLLSSSSDTNQSSGRFQLLMQNDGNLVLYPAYSASTASDAYWASGSYFDRTKVNYYYLYLNKTGPRPLRVIDGNNSNRAAIWIAHDWLTLDSSHPSSNTIIYRATVDPDGIFRLYAHFDDESGKRQVRNLWSALDNLCSVKTFCGFNSYCTYNDNQPYCECLPGNDFIDPSKKNLGCKTNFIKPECQGGKENEALYKMNKLGGMTLSGIPYAVEIVEVRDDCRSSCLEDCYCGAALYDESNRNCEKQELPLRYVIRKMEEGSSSSILYLKVGLNSSLKSGKDKPPPEPKPITRTSKKAIVLIFIMIFGFAIILCFVVATSSLLIYRIGALSYKRLLGMGDFGLNEGVTLRVFSYNELRKATNGFRQELGKGSFGSVYKGTLHKGRKMIAVKRLEKLIEEGEREFQAEMQAIGKTHHRNLVRLMGYCAEGSKRLLVYEFMSNGSLGNFIFGDSSLHPNWDQKKRIALDIARGLLYLHEECEAPIIHCDIKPQNILMDEFLVAKISDFGLAKLLVPDQTRTFTQVRGTRGYVAPEWNKNTPITVKADVYSYGIMLLEIVFCRRSIVVNTMNPEQIVLSNWVYKCFVRRELSKLVLGEEVDQTLLENMVKVGLWCIQDEPFLRPSMKCVVLMLEGVTDVAIPPCPSSAN
ncbi:G-type lectin S-receptor-like serine/threonine-protein kinase LECRK3 isoform X2 [Prosopis cineraria]|nr:G-type lectin S-receptor-like serine/threonine-protein kinase LECRK3 isoform X2 [Prosopis cineraria]